MIARETAIVVSVSIVALVVAAALGVDREVLVAIGGVAIGLAGSMEKIYDRERGKKDGAA